MREPQHMAVLCDIDGVLRHWPPADTLDRAHGLPSGTFAAAAFAPERLIPAITGQVTDEQWRANVETALAAACGSAQTAKAVVRAWSNQAPTVDADVATLLRKVRDTIPVALVSNATTRLELDLERAGLGDFADTVANTARIGYAKPDPRVYATAAERVGVPAHHCLFIDDTAANVKAAQSLGMTGIHYRRFTDIREALLAIG